MEEDSKILVARRPFSFAVAFATGAAAALCVVGFFIGWSMRSCGGKGDPLLTYALIGPILFPLPALAVAVGGFVIGGFVRFASSKSAVIAAAIALTASVVLGYMLLAPAGCRLDM